MNYSLDHILDELHRHHQRAHLWSCGPACAPPGAGDRVGSVGAVPAQVILVEMRTELSHFTAGA